MNQLSKLLPVLTVFSLFLVGTSYAGPRPDYNSSSQSNISKTPMALKAGSAANLLSGSTRSGGFVAPVPGGLASLGSYTSRMPAPRLDSTYSLNTPYPTNKWFTSLFVNPKPTSQTTTQNKFGNRFFAAPMLAVYSSRYPYGWHEEWPFSWTDGAGYGYSLGGYIKQVSGGNVYASNALAFAVQGATSVGTTDETVIHGDEIKLKNFSDWSVTTVLQDKDDAAKRMTTTFGKGFVFTYNTFSPGVSPRIRVKYVRDEGDVLYYLDNNGTMQDAGSGRSITTDHIMIRVKINKTDDNVNYQFGTVANQYQYFGVYAPPGSTFTISQYNWNAWQHMQWLNITFPASATREEDRYLSIALLKSPSSVEDNAGAFEIFKEYYNYAYNFITDTQVSWDYDKSHSELTTTYNFSFDAKRTGGNFISNQTIFALYPHQWKNLVGTPSRTNTYTSIRGLMKVSAGNSFQTKHRFHGMVPFLTYEVPEGTATAKLQTYVDYDRTFEPSQARVENGYKGNSNTYYHGKAVARAANLIPIFHQGGHVAARNQMIQKLRAELTAWYSGSALKNFKYDSSWGGIVGSNPGNVSDFGASQFTDHHFHYGYFIYASAILAIYDPDFASTSQFKGMVDLLVKEIANPVRTDTSFPFLRNFDVYEGHSYANGLGGGDWYFSNDEESSSEAMNAWAAIYLWGIATGNQNWINLGIYGYTTQWEATKNYYLNMDGDIWSRTDFNHISVGMLFDSTFRWSLWWPPQVTQTVMGIQVLPLTPSLLYLGYDTTYVRNFYNEMWAGRNTTTHANMWKDIWLRLKSLFDAPSALSDWDSVNLPAGFADTFDRNSLSGGGGDDGSSMTYSYHFINFFNAMGTVETGYYADDTSYLVTNKNGTRTFFAYNPDKQNYRTVNFYKNPSSAVPSVPNGGSMTIPPGTMVQTVDFLNFKYTNTDTSFSANASSNTQRDVYSIFSDNFLGAVIGGDTYNDIVYLDAWEESTNSGNVATVNISTHASMSDAFEGESYRSATRTGALWGGWGYRFAGPMDMSSFYNGEIEVSLKLDRPSTVAGDFEIGFETIAGQTWFKLSDLNFDQTRTGWQTLTIPLNSVSNSMITAQNLSFITLPFIMKQNSGSAQSEWGIPVYFDSILWKKGSPSGNITAELKDTSSGGEPSAQITWDTSVFGHNNSVAQQYIEIGLNYVVGNSWGIQMYTDNKSSSTVAAHNFTGVISTDTPSGLVNARSPHLPMLPMRWRAAPSNIPEDEIFLNEWQDPWKYFRDLSAFTSSSESGLYSGCDEIKFMDRRGYRWRWNYETQAGDYGTLPEDKKIRIYFLADFTYAKRNSLYGANIIIEFFNE